MSAQPQTKPATGTETVTVACKIPQGFTLQLHEMREVSEVTLGGSRTVKQAFPIDDAMFVLNGPAHPQDRAPRSQMVGGFAITKGVPKAFWDAWMAQTGKYHPAVKNNMLIAYPDTARAVDFAKEHRKVKTGLERLDPNNLPVLNPKFKIQTGDDTPSDTKAQLAMAGADTDD